MTTEITVANVVAGEGKVVAEFTVHLGPAITVHGCKWIAGSRGHFLAMPSRRPANSDAWLPVVELTEGLSSRVRHAIEAALRDASTSAAGSR